MNNGLRLYASYLGVPVPLANRLLEQAENIRFSSVYPGGFFDSFSCFIPCDPRQTNPIKWCQDLYVRNGLKTVWYGLITQITLVTSSERQGIEIAATGYLAYWNYTAESRRWIDRRTSSHVKGVWEWVEEKGVTSFPKCAHDQNSRLLMTPQPLQWYTGKYVAFRYNRMQSPYIRRVKFDYNLQEGAQAWELTLYDVTNSAVLWTTAATGTGSQDITIAAGTNITEMDFRLYARANQVPPDDGSVYGEITNLAVFCENTSGAAVNTVHDVLCAIAADLGYTDTTYIAANTYDLTTVGFVSDDNSESILNMVQRLIKFSATNTAYSFGYHESGALYYEVQPDLSDYDYIVHLGDPNLSGMELVLSADFGELFNNLFVDYTDSANKLNIVTHWVDPALDDAASEAKYFARKYRARAGSTSQAGAIAYGKQILAAKKDLRYYVRSPLKVVGSIQKKDGTFAPVSEVRAGRRIRLADFSTDMGDVFNSGLTFLISRTEYNDSDQSMSISCGVPDDLAIYLARMSVMNNRNV